jgi:hypothetical protein
VKEILNLAAEVSRKFYEYNNPRWNIPLIGRFSRKGHLQQLSEKQDKLVKELNDYDQNCPSPLPAVITEIATRPVPQLTPSPVNLPPPPNIKPSTAAAVATGITLTTILWWLLGATLVF